LGKDSHQCQKTGGGNGAANRTTGKETNRSPGSSRTAKAKKLIGHQKTHHHHHQATHRDLEKSRKRQKAVKSEGGSLVIKEIAGTYTQ
jgi:hypothetical protein